jgi:hypothetical protein
MEVERVPDTAAPPDRLFALDPEMLDDLVPDWPELVDAVLADWEPGDAELADWDPEDPAPERPEAGGQEVLKADYWDRACGDGGGFAAGGVADRLPPGSVLAGFAANAWGAGLDRISDDELIGVMRAARRLASWAAAMELAAIGDLWRRRVAEEEIGDTGAASHANDEIAAALTLNRTRRGPGTRSCYRAASSAADQPGARRWGHRPAPGHGDRRRGHRSR